MLQEMVRGGLAVAEAAVVAVSTCSKRETFRVVVLEGGRPRALRIAGSRIGPSITSAISCRCLPPSPLRDQLWQLLAEEARLWEAIDMCCEHQQRITDDVLEVSHMRAGRFALHERVFALSSAKAALFNTFAAQARSLDMALILEDTSPKGLLLRADPQRIQQVLANLLSNAIKFTASCPERRVVLRVNVESTDEAGIQAALAQFGPSDANAVGVQRGSRLVMVTFAVSDTGIGMTEEQRQRLFLPFHQATPKTHSTYGGSGMGLFICRGLASLLRATISVESALNVGSTFTFRVPSAVVEEGGEGVAAHEDFAAPIRRPARRRPLTPEPDADTGVSALPTGDKPLRTPSSVLSAQAAPKSPYHILVAEDNDINRKVLQKQLESASGRPYCVTLAVDGLEAVAQFERAAPPPDLIIMDVEMPNMNGLEATERIRAIERERGVVRGIPIVGLSGNARQEQIDITLGRGMSGYLAKPCRQPALLAYLERFLPKRPS